MQMKKLGILGLDNWYYTFLVGKLGQQSGRFKVTAAYDQNQAHLKEFAAQFMVEATGSPESLVAREDVEAVVVGSATGLHLQDLKPVLAQKKPVLLAKPLAMSYADAKTILSQLKEAGVPAGMLHNYRFNPVLRMVKSLLEEGVIGEITSLYDITHATLPEGWPGMGHPGWYDEKDLAGGGGFIDHAAHTVDTMLWYIGSQPKSVSATIANIRQAGLKSEDYGIAIVTFENGVIGTVESTWLGKTSQLRITGTAGEIFVERGSRPTITVRKNSDVGTEVIHVVEGLSFLDVVGKLVDNFLDVIEGKSENVVPVEQGVEALKLIEKAYEAARSGRVIMF